jgi:hypothetical protein
MQFTSAYYGTWREYGQRKKYGQVSAILILSHIVNKNQHHQVTNIGQVAFVETVANCEALRVVRRH